MPSFRKIFGLLLFASLAPLVMNCAPDQAAKLRAEKSLTLGYPGVSYRPNGKVAVGMTGAYSSMGTKVTESTDDGKMSISGVTTSTNTTPSTEGDRVIAQKTTQLNPFVQYFPWDTSAFFVGAGASYQTKTSRFDEKTSSWTLAEPAYAPVTTNTTTTYLAVPVGWAWIWGTGFSLTLDFGPRIRMSQSTKFTNDGSTAGVDADRRSRTVDAINDQDSRLSLGGASSILGWAF